METQNNLKRDIFICDCHSLEHIFAMWYDPELNHVYIEPHLAKKPFWKRIIYAIKYVFGYQSRFGAFDEVIVNPDDVEKINECLNKIKTCNTLSQEETGSSEPI